MEVDTLNIREIENPYFRAASITLNDYLSKYPEKSAPALMLQGVLMMDMGECAIGFVFIFDQAAIEISPAGGRADGFVELVS